MSNGTIQLSFRQGIFIENFSFTSLVCTTYLKKEKSKITPMWLIQVYKENKQQQRLEIKKKKMFPGLLTNSATTGLIFSP